MKYSADDDTNIAAGQQYNLMTLEDLKAMPIKNITEKNAVLFMWCVNPLMPEAFELMKTWGFKYKTLLTLEEMRLELQSRKLFVSEKVDEGMNKLPVVPVVEVSQPVPTPTPTVE